MGFQEHMYLKVKYWCFLYAQEQALTTSESFAAVPGHGIAQSPCYPATSPKQPVPPCASPTVDYSDFSGARACSESESESSFAHWYFLPALGYVKGFYEHLSITVTWCWGLWLLWGFVLRTLFLNDLRGQKLIQTHFWHYMFYGIFYIIIVYYKYFILLTMGLDQAYFFFLFKGRSSFIMFIGDLLTW